MIKNCPKNGHFWHQKLECKISVEYFSTKIKNVNFLDFFLAISRTNCQKSIKNRQIKDTSRFQFLIIKIIKFLDIFVHQIAVCWKNIRTNPSQKGYSFVILREGSMSLLADYIYKQFSISGSILMIFGILRYIIIRLGQYYILVIQIPPIF